jgi:hypothetical protein
VNSGESTNQGEETGRITHTIDIDQVLMPPVLTKWNCIGESMFLSHTITSSWVLSTSDGLREGDIHDIFIQLSHRDSGGDKVVGPGWLGKDDSLVGITMVRCHLDQSGHQ